MSKLNTIENIWSRVKQTDTCWKWTGCHDKAGYGRARWHGKLWAVHRLIWTFERGEIPEGLEIDHLCFVRDCCNLAHLELVDRAENMRRMPMQIRKKTHCKRGHEMVGDAFRMVQSATGKMVKRCNVCFLLREKLRWQEQWEERRARGARQRERKLTEPELIQVREALGTRLDDASFLAARRRSNR